MLITCSLCNGHKTVKTTDGKDNECPLCSGKGNVKASDLNKIGDIPQYLLTEFPFDHEGHYQVFMALYGNNVRYTREAGWLVYHDGFWDKDLSDKYLSLWITDVLRKRKTAVTQEGGKAAKSLADKCAASRSNLDSVKAICKDRMLAKLTDFNTEPHLLNVANGVLDLKSFELKPHSADYMFDYKVKVKWNPEADTTEWVDFVAQCVGEDAADFTDKISALELLQLAAGYSLTGDTSAETMFYVFGPPRSGKGTFMTAIQKVMGPLSDTVNIGTLCEVSHSDSQNFGLAALARCRYITVAETGRDTYLDAGRVKNLTGNDPIQCAYKFKDTFSYTPKFKVWISSNHEINMDAGDDAVWDRLRAFHFLNGHKDNPDTSIKRRMTTHLEPVLLWCAQGAQAWYRLQEQGKPMPRTEKMRNYLQERKDEGDYIKQFLEDQGIEAAGYREDGSVGDYIPAFDLYGRFKDYCSKSHIEKHLSLRNFISDMKRRGFLYVQKKHMERNSRGFAVRHVVPKVDELMM